MYVVDKTNKIWEVIKMLVAENDEFKLLVGEDSYSESPREWCNLGSMVCFHSRHVLGDKHSFNDPDQFFYELAEKFIGDTDKVDEMDDYEIREYVASLEDEGKQLIMLPLFLYDHSGLTISTTPFSCPWDSGQIGYIYTTFDRIKEFYNIFDADGMPEGDMKDILDDVKKHLISEVKTYDCYLRGDVYEYILFKKVKCITCGHIEYETVDSCCGFYSMDDIKGELGEKYYELFDNLKWR